ncbi:MAG TPA: hypothetical protein PK909_01445, partial [Sphaerochaeta sp.]|nr:hypothetical protein [Sphaerochaeta sp.]
TVRREILMIVPAGTMTGRDGNMTIVLEDMMTVRREILMIVPAGTMTGRDGNMTIVLEDMMTVRREILMIVPAGTMTGRSGMNGPEGSGKPRRSPMGLEPRLLGRHEKRSDGNLHA